MAKRTALKDPQKEVALFHRRVILISIVIFLFVIAVVSRLVWLQIFQHELYTTLSEQNQFNLVPLDPPRGLIFDRKGVLLAKNTPVFDLEVIPEKVPNLTRTLKNINKLLTLTDDELKLFKKEINQHKSFEPAVLKTKLSEEQVAKFLVNQVRFPGVILNTKLIRRYVYDQTFVPVLGYVGRINEQELTKLDKNYQASHFIGKNGVEKYYEDALHGEVGYQQVEIDASGRSVRILKQVLPIRGDNLYLTIDSGLQKATEQAFAGNRGAAIAIDPNNGEILALVSNPGFDPNLFVMGISNKDYQALQNAPERPLYNRAIRGLYPPGSTIKPFMALAGLSSGLITPQFTISDPGYFQLPTHTYHDWQKKGHGRVNMPKAIMQSCDTYFYTLAHKIGINRIDDMLWRFGFGKLTEIDITDELSGIVPSPAWKKRVKGESWYPGDTVITGIGQGFTLVTPLQLAHATAGIAKRGQHFRPHLLLKSESFDGTMVTEKLEPLPLIQLPEEDWDVIEEGMLKVMGPGGTGYHYGAGAPYKIAAKTGTAQVFSLRANEKYDKHKVPEWLRDNKLFIAYAPADKPTIAVAVIAENSLVMAGDVARKMMDYYLIQSKAPSPTTQTAPPPRW
jgi:penicillin-binding protein 2